MYNAFLKILSNIIISNIILINKWASNYELVGLWDKFEYKKNVASEEIRDVIKLRSIIITLWIKSG